MLAFGCNPPQPAYEPEDVARMWQGFIDQNAFDSARVYSTDAASRYVDLLDALTPSEGGAVISITLLRELECEVYGNTARCFFVVKNELGQDVPDTLELRLVKHRWLVDWKAPLLEGSMDSLLKGLPNSGRAGDSIDPELE